MQSVRWLSAALLCAGVFSVQAQEPRAGQAPAGQRRNDSGRNFLAIGAPPDPAAVARGEKLYVPSCGFCHGTSAKGGQSGPDLVRSVLVLHDEKGDKIGPVILNGRPDKGMPKFQMTPAQITDIAAFLLSRSQGAANRMEYKILNIVTGNASAGQAYFGAHCATCHSPTGDLKGIASRYEAVALQTRFLYPRTRSFGAGGLLTDRGAATKVTVTAAGQTFTGTLVNLDDFGVGLVDAGGEYHSWLLEPGNGVKVEVQDPLQAHIDMLKTYTDADMHNVLAYLETLK